MVAHGFLFCPDAYLKSVEHPRLVIVAISIVCLFAESIRSCAPPLLRTLRVLRPLRLLARSAGMSLSSLLCSRRCRRGERLRRRRRLHARLLDLGDANLHGIVRRAPRRPSSQHWRRASRRASGPGSGGRAVVRAWRRGLRTECAARRFCGDRRPAPRSREAASPTSGGRGRGASQRSASSPRRTRSARAVAKKKLRRQSSRRRCAPSATLAQLQGRR